MVDQRVLVIAEAGVNHNGDIDIAKQLIDVAALAGADLVKFQTFTADRLVVASARKADYQVEATQSSETQQEMLQRLELSISQHEDLIDHCKSKNIGFFSTAFDTLSLDALVGLGLELFKVPSGEVNNIPYLRRIGSYGKRIIISTGMSQLGEVETAIEVLEASGTTRDKLTVLHCNTEYPTPMKDVNLRAMITMRDAFHVDVGYSDHTLGIEVPIAAVALGARVIEKHFTLDRNMEGPDHRASLEPFELEKMVDSIRNIEVALGSGLKNVSPSESKNIRAARKSIVAATDIRVGESFNDANLAVKRPGDGLSPTFWDLLTGMQAKRDYKKDDYIEL